MKPKLNYSRAGRIAALGGVLILLASLHASPAATTQETKPARRPNIILIYTDDQDRDEMGCFGGKVLTPHMDSLARDGVRFTRFYVASGVCCPSRYNALTGRYASRSLSTQKRQPTTGSANLGFESGVYGEPTCVARALQAGGYVTGMVGKWHQSAGASPTKPFPADADPNDPAVKQALRANYDQVVERVKSCGFDYAASIYNYNLEGGAAKTPFWIPRALGVHNMEWVTDGALKFIAQNKDRPFFLYLAPTLVHSPAAITSLKADPRITPAGFLDQAPNVQPSRQSVLERVQQAGVDKKMAGPTWLDDGVGAVLQKLKDLGLAENTVILLAGDNGNKAKFTCYDGATHEPFVARWPGVIKPGTVCDKLVANIDFAPTILEIAGVPPLPGVQLDGRSIERALQGDASYQRESLMLEITTERAVVSADGFKYIAVRYNPAILEQIKQGRKFNHACEPMETARQTFDAVERHPTYFDLDQLFNLNTDPSEQKNLAQDPNYKTKLAQLQQQLRDYSQKLPHQFGEFTKPNQAP